MVFISLKKNVLAESKNNNTQVFIFMVENKFKVIEALIKNKFPDINILGWEKRVIGPTALRTTKPDSKLNTTYYVVKLDLSGTEYEKDEFYNEPYDELAEYLESLRRFTNLRFMPEYITIDDLTN